MLKEELKWYGLRYRLSLDGADTAELCLGGVLLRQYIRDPDTCLWFRLDGAPFGTGQRSVPDSSFSHAVLNEAAWDYGRRKDAWEREARRGREFEDGGLKVMFEPDDSLQRAPGASRAEAGKPPREEA